MNNNIFVYRPDLYSGPIAIDCKPSKECDEYHKNSVIYFMNEMTQEEFSMRIGDKKITQHKFNTIKHPLSHEEIIEPIKFSASSKEVNDSFNISANHEIPHTPDKTSGSD